MEGAIIGYVRISDDTLAQSHWGNLDPIWAPIFIFLYLFLQEFCDFFGTWDLRFFDIPKDAVFVEILVLSKLLVFQQ